MKKEPPFIRLYKDILITAVGCWEWRGQVGSSGYGQIKVFGKLVLCHRLSYELHHGAIPTGQEIMHSCDNRICINPDHLSSGVHRENMADAASKNAWKNVNRTGVKGVHKSQSKQVLVKGKPYGSIKEAERELGLSSGTVAYWIKTNSQKAIVIDKSKYLELKNEQRLKSM